MALQPRGMIQAPIDLVPAAVPAPAPIQYSGKMITVPRDGKDYQYPVS